jgi:hypothetical protein
MEYTRINWQNTDDTPVNAANLNKMDKAIAELVNELARLSKIEKLAVFPNQSNSRISNGVNFKSTNGYTLTYGNLGVLNDKLVITNEEYASTQLTATLKNNLVLNADKSILLKLRVKATTNASIYPKLGLADGTSVFVPDTFVLASNMNTNSIPYYKLTPDKWEDIWCIIGADIDTEIESINLHIAPYTTLEIASLHAFYSQDTGSGSTGGIESVNHYILVDNNLSITPTPYTEGEI